MYDVYYVMTPSGSWCSIESLISKAIRRSVTDQLTTTLYILNQSRTITIIRHVIVKVRVNNNQVFS